jgi:hypothetical protein
MFCNAVPRISGMFVNEKIIENLGLRHLFCIDTLKARYSKTAIGFVSLYLLPLVKGFLPRITRRIWQHLTSYT